MLASTVVSQMTNGESSHAVMLLICSPLVKIVVMIRTTNTVTNAIPPLRAGRYLIDIFITNGASMICITVKNSTLVMKPSALIEKSSNNKEAIIRPMALPSIASTEEAKKRSMLNTQKLLLFRREFFFCDNPFVTEICEFFNLGSYVIS